MTAQPVDWDPITLTPDGDAVVMDCRTCGANVTVAMDPTAVFLEAIDSFVTCHAACY